MKFKFGFISVNESNWIEWLNPALIKWIDLLFAALFDEFRILIPAFN